MKKKWKNKIPMGKNQHKNVNNFIILSWIVKILGKKYLDECITIFEELIKDIKIKMEIQHYKQALKKFQKIWKKLYRVTIMVLIKIQAYLT